MLGAASRIRKRKLPRIGYWPAPEDGPEIVIVVQIILHCIF